MVVKTLDTENHALYAWEKRDGVVHKAYLVNNLCITPATRGIQYPEDGGDVMLLVTFATLATHLSAESQLPSVIHVYTNIIKQSDAAANPRILAGKYRRQFLQGSTSARRGSSQYSFSVAANTDAYSTLLQWLHEVKEGNPGLLPPLRNQIKVNL